MGLETDQFNNNAMVSSFSPPHLDGDDDPHKHQLDGHDDDGDDDDDDDDPHKHQLDGHG